MNAITNGLNPDSVGHMHLSHRAGNVLFAQGVTSMGELAHLDPATLRSYRNAGWKTFQEFGRELLRLGFRPIWLGELAGAFEYELWADCDQAKLDNLYETGWGVIAGPYEKREHAMLEGVLADLERANTEYVVCREVSGGLIVLRQNMLEVTLEKPEE